MPIPHDLGRPFEGWPYGHIEQGAVALISQRHIARVLATNYTLFNQFQQSWHKAC